MQVHRAGGVQGGAVQATGASPRGSLAVGEGPPGSPRAGGGGNGPRPHPLALFPSADFLLSHRLPHNPLAPTRSHIGSLFSANMSSSRCTQAALPTAAFNASSGRCRAQLRGERSHPTATSAPGESHAAGSPHAPPPAGLRPLGAFMLPLLHLLHRRIGSDIGCIFQWNGYVCQFAYF
uniref:Uncharacterized protein n=1 Tax=Triticum urartu TaxID=4572 RepID=A0A8R7PBE1_TRIUA